MDMEGGGGLQTFCNIVFMVNDQTGRGGDCQLTSTITSRQINHSSSQPDDRQYTVHCTVYLYENKIPSSPASISYYTLRVKY